MTGHAWLDGLLAAVMVLVAVFAAARLAVARRRGRAADFGADGLHILMGIAMAGMFAPRLSPFPAAAWQAVFAASAVLFVWRAVRRRVQRHGEAQGSRLAHPVPHAVESAAMVYMFLPGSPQPGGHESATIMPRMTMTSSGIRNPALALVLTLFLLGYILWTTDSLGGHHPASKPTSLAPRLTACAKIAMSGAMGYMLLLTL